jgi:hypothetical protein
MVISWVSNTTMHSIDNLLLQLEYNHVRPYVYSHSVPITNYGHNNQSDINGAVISKIYCYCSIP